MFLPGPWKMNIYLTRPSKYYALSGPAITGHRALMIMVLSRYRNFSVEAVVEEIEHLSALQKELNKKRGQAQNRPAPFLS